MTRCLLPGEISSQVKKGLSAEGKGNQIMVPRLWEIYYRALLHSQYGDLQSETRA